MESSTEETPEEKKPIMEAHILPATESIQAIEEHLESVVTIPTVDSDIEVLEKRVKWWSKEYATAQGMCSDGLVKDIGKSLERNIKLLDVVRIERLTISEVGATRPELLSK